MESKTLLDHIGRIWPDAVKIDPKAVPNRGLINRHTRLLNTDTSGDIQQELLVFQKKHPDINRLVDVVSIFLRKNNMDVVSPPRQLHVSSRKEAIRIQKTERFIMGLYGKSKKTPNGFKQMGETYHLVCYPNIDLIIIYSYSGELQWSPQ